MPLSATVLQMSSNQQRWLYSTTLSLDESMKKLHKQKQFLWTTTCWKNWTLKVSDLLQQNLTFPSSLVANPTSTPSVSPLKSIDQVQPNVQTLARESLRAIRRGVALELTPEGCGGVYVIHEDVEGKKPLAVFKPRAEEFMAPENPRGYCVKDGEIGVTEHPVQPGFCLGDGALKEQAAYLLDAAYGNFSGVPMTTMVKFPIGDQVKQGSLQEYVESFSSCEDMGTFHHVIEDVCKIGILDIRLFNTDRHAGNILLQHKQPTESNSSYRMIPIDHGFCLPSWRHLETATFEWLHWPQAKFPFQPEALDHISSLKPEEDAEILREIGVCEQSIVTMRLCTRLLKKGAAAGYSLFDIGNVMQREGDGSSQSPFEKIIFLAEKSMCARYGNEWENSFVDEFIELVDGKLESLFKKVKPQKARSVSCA